MNPLETYLKEMRDIRSTGVSYREHELLGRALTADEAREVTGMARRLSAIVLMQPALDENYRRVAASAYAWPGVTA